MGHAESQVYRVSGMILNPRFYEIEPLSRRGSGRRARASWASIRSSRSGWCCSAARARRVMADIARSLPGRQLLLICGHNPKLRPRSRTMPRRRADVRRGLHREVPRYMQLADYFIGKPGPGSISEAVAMRLPMIVERNAWTLPQERYNTDWVREQGVGVVLPNFRGIARAVDEMLEPSNYARFRTATERIHNRAVFEIPDILEEILVRSEPAPRDNMRG